jgi:hypothetical protein
MLVGDRCHYFRVILLLQVAVKVIEHSSDTSAVVENEVKLMMQVNITRARNSKIVLIIHNIITIMASSLLIMKSISF